MRREKKRFSLKIYGFEVNTVTVAYILYKSTKLLFFKTLRNTLNG